MYVAHTCVGICYILYVSYYIVYIIYSVCIYVYACACVRRACIRCAWVYNSLLYIQVGEPNYFVVGMRLKYHCPKPVHRY